MLPAVPWPGSRASSNSYRNRINDNSMHIHGTVTRSPAALHARSSQRLQTSTKISTSCSRRGSSQLRRRSHATVRVLASAQETRTPQEGFEDTGPSTSSQPDAPVYAPPPPKPSIRYAQAPPRRRLINLQTAAASYPRPAAGSTGDICYRCKQPGHWARDCPNASSPAIGSVTRPASGSFTSPAVGSPTGSATSPGRDICFLCRQPGHWAKDCPNMGRSETSRNGAASTITTTSTSTPYASSLCFRCGQPGHWARDCPTLGASPAATRSYYGGNANVNGSNSAYASTDGYGSDALSERGSVDGGAPEGSAGPSGLITLSSLFPNAAKVLMPSQQPSIVRYHLSGDQRSAEWLASRDLRLTASALVRAVGVAPYKGRASGAGPRQDLFYEKLGITKVTSNKAMEHGQYQEPKAFQAYQQMSGQQVATCDFVTYQQREDASSASSSLAGDLSCSPDQAWLGGSPDGLVLANQAAVEHVRRSMGTAELQPDVVMPQLLKGAGILEIKCPFVEGLGEPSKNSKYLFQIQALMEFLDLEWADLFVYQARTREFMQVRVMRDRQLWGEMLPVLRSFWWDHVIPARQVLNAYLSNGGDGQDRLQMKKVVAEFLPQALPGKKTQQLQDWVLDMYQRADKVES